MGIKDGFFFARTNKIFDFKGLVVVRYFQSSHLFLLQLKLLLLFPHLFLLSYITIQKIDQVYISYVSLQGGRLKMIIRTSHASKELRSYRGSCRKIEKV